MAMERNANEQIDGNGAAPGAGDHLASERRLWERFSRNRDPVLREELIGRYMPFAKGLALRYRGASESVDDLIQVANLGLVNAVDRFDPERGTPFAAFAAPTILGELKRHFRDRVWTVRVPRGLHDRIAEVEKAITELTEQEQRPPSVREISGRLEMDELEVLEVLEANQNRRTLSLDHPAGSEDSDDPLTEWLGDDDKGYELIEGRLALEEAIPHLSDRERLVLRLRFAEDMTQSQIAERIGCSQMHVSRILRRTLDRIRMRIEEERRRDAGARGPRGG
jgi:RNA polymerase sigma-B factor